MNKTMTSTDLQGYSSPENDRPSYWEGSMTDVQNGYNELRMDIYTHAS